MPDTQPTAPTAGLRLVSAVIVAAIVATAWFRLGRVTFPTSAAWPDMRLDINAATEAQLNSLPGIGPRNAQRIVADRRAHGPFEAVADLDRVPGIGPAIVGRIEPHVVAGLQPGRATDD